MKSIKNWLSPSKDTILKMKEKRNIQGLLRILTDSSNFELRNVALEALTTINDTQSLEKIITQLLKNHKAFEVVESTALYRIGKNSMWGLDLLRRRKSALDLLGKMDTAASDSLKKAFEYGGDISQNQAYSMEENYIWEINAAIIKCGKPMIPFLKEKLFDNSPIKDLTYFHKLSQADRAALLLKEIEIEAIHDPRVLNCLVNIARFGMPLKGASYGYHGDREDGKLSACGGIVSLGKHELVLDIIIELALRTWEQGGTVNLVTPTETYEKALNLLGKVHTQQSFDALEKAFNFECKKLLSHQDFTGFTKRYMEATDKAILSSGKSMSRFLIGKLDDSTMIYFGTSESYKENKVFAIKQSDRARLLLSKLGISM